MMKEKKSYTKTQFKKEFAKLMESTSIPSNIMPDAEDVVKSIERNDTI